MYRLMDRAPFHPARSSFLTGVFATFALLTACCCGSPEALAGQSTEIILLNQIHAGMRGYAFTIFEGDEVQKFELVVLGVMDNFMGPKQSIILVQLVGTKVEHTGVVAGMSGSPVYFDGKLAGALSLKLGTFTKEPIAGVTPIEDILRPPPDVMVGQSSWPVTGNAPSTSFSGLGSGAALQPIETPLVFSGFQTATLQQFAPQLQNFGFVAAQGGTAPARADDSHLQAGDMAGMVLVQGDASINSACTVTAVRGDHVYLCGHPFLSLGDVQLPMARSRVIATLSSNLASTKIVNVGGSIGTITGDHLTAVTGTLGPPPALIPMDLTFVTPTGEKRLHFQLVNHPKLTPLLVALTTFNGLTQNSLYGEGTTLHMTGEIVLHGHAAVQLENTFSPGESLGPDGIPIALNVQNTFAKLFSNIYERPEVDHISLRVESTSGHQSFTIESAWLEKGEAAPGENVRVRVRLRPYRGAPRIADATLHVPEQAVRGSNLRVLISDADLLNRASRGFMVPGTGGSVGIDQLISLLNHERRNDCVYVGLFVPSPTILWDDKELPNAPLSQISIVDGRPAPGSVQVLRESLASESAIALGGPVSGVISLNLAVR